ncbi:MAG TPA: Rrf2 family transcriptional regulator [Brevundimonas sp.]|uniref:Rrf2 family transcriptional regulator n=1 Tax=Brevundimonas sp. TaxID=1871086 RepID=UPI002CF559F4|nr:Rrf2 family transcriptional regulator [Brevundimonas sp.]HRH20490.1 Rrf2 family transcriptional regulator [Brevundimonas sp.]
MRLSTRGRYAVMAMADLARNSMDDGAERAVSLAEIAERQEISLSYLEQLFSRLRKGGLVTSVRGPGGGYRLTTTPDQTWIADIVLAVDEPLRATRCAGQGSPRGCMVGGERCITHDLWDGLGREIHRYLASVSLADVIAPRACATQRMSAALSAVSGAPA